MSKRSRGSKRVHSAPSTSHRRLVGGWGLTETLLTVGAISAMSVAVYMALHSTDAAAQVKVEQSNLRDLSRAVDRSIGLLGSFEGISAAQTLDDDLAPARMRSAGGLQTIWGAPVSIRSERINADHDAFVVSYPNTPPEVCAGLASSMARDAFLIRVDGASVYDSQGLNQAAAAQRCAAGNTTMEFVFHSGMATGKAVAAPVVLPPTPPTITPPPTTPPVITIPDTPDVDPVTPGTPAAPPPSAPPPVLPPLVSPAPPPAAVLSPPPVSVPPPPPVTPPGTICEVPPTQTRRVRCPSGQAGQVDQQRVGYCADDPGGPYEAWQSPRYDVWTETGRTCVTCPAPSTQVETRWTPTTGACPAGTLGSHTWERQQRRERSVTHECSSSPWTPPGPTYGSWSTWSNTGSTRNEVNTCEPICEVPNPATETNEQTRKGSQTLNCPSGQLGEIKQERPERRTQTRTASCPAPTGPVAWTPWSSWSPWAGTGSWVTVSNTCAAACVVPNPNPQVDTETRNNTRTQGCPSGQWGIINQARPEYRTRQRTGSCPAPTGPVAWTPWSSFGPWTGSAPWAETSRTCTGCPAPSTDTQLDWEPRSASCPAGQSGTHTWEEQRRRSRSVSYSCPAGTTSLPSPTYGTYGSWSWTGNKRNEVNTCKPVGPPPLDGKCTSRPMITGCATYSVTTRTPVTPVSIGEDNGTFASWPGEYVRCTIGYADNIAADGFPSIGGDQFRYRFVDRGGCGFNDWDSQYGIPEVCASYVRVYAKNADGTNGELCFGEAKITFNWEGMEGGK